jgi:hypothetical protein
MVLQTTLSAELTPGPPITQAVRILSMQEAWQTRNWRNQGDREGSVPRITRLPCNGTTQLPYGTCVRMAFSLRHKGALEAGIGNERNNCQRL